MPSEKILQEKQAYVEGLAEKLKSAVAGVVVSYQGLNVADDTQLRRELRAAGVEYAVVKNTLLRRACDIAGLPGLDEVLNGTTALALSSDHVAAAKNSRHVCREEQGCTDQGRLRRRQSDCR